MANRKITECTELTTAPAADDVIAIVDISDTTDAASGTTKKQQWLNAIKWLFGSRFAEDAGANDTYTATLVPAPTAYITGEHYRFKANTANTGACTVNFNGLGAKTIKKAAGGITTDLADNDIRAGQWVDLVYDGINLQMQSQLGNVPSGGSIAPLEIVDANTVRQINGATPQTFQIFTNATLKYEFNGSEFIPPTGAPNHGSTTNRWGVSHANQFNAPSGGLFRFQGKSQIEDTGTDGWIVIKPNSGSAMKISLGDTATAAAMIKRNGTTVEARKGDDSDYGEFGAVQYFYGDKANNVFDGFGSGSPEGAVTAAVGSTFRRTDGGAGTSFYVKESGAGNTGWVGK